MAKWLIKWEQTEVFEMTVEADTLEQAVEVIQGANGLDEDPRHDEAWTNAEYVDWMSQDRVVSAEEVG